MKNTDIVSYAEQFALDATAGSRVLTPKERRAKAEEFGKLVGRVFKDVGPRIERLVIREKVTSIS